MHHRRGSLHARLLCGAAFIGLTFASAASAEEAIKFDIKPQTLTSALNEFGVQSRTAVLFRADVANSKVTQGLVGTVEPETALKTMLAGTDLTYRREGDAFVIMQQGEGGGGSSPQGESVAAVEELIVTAQKKEEQIQDVPIAISAFTQKSLDAQKLEGGFDLLKAIPNVTFSKNNFSGYNFSIRGIGTKAVSATTDPGVAVSFNNTTLIVNRLFEQEYFDIERVEVLRGPQGTLYGRNATSGVINVLSARPRLMEFEGDLKLETGNYNAKRLRGMVNVPIGDTLAIRAAGALTKRDGYGINEAAGTPGDFNGVSPDVDGRDLWSARVTVGWKPIETLRVNALWERFEEDDNRVRTSKQLCHHDEGGADLVESSLGNYDWNVNPSALSDLSRASLSQGCKAGSLYAEEAYGTPNGASLPYISALYWGPVFGGNLFLAEGEEGIGTIPEHLRGCEQNRGITPLNLCQADPYGNRRQSEDLRTIHSLIEPIYRAKADIFELSVDFDLTDSLSLTSQTVYARDEVYASQDYNRYTTLPIWNDSATACGGPNGTDCSQPGTYADGYYNVTPGGVYTDPQLGPSNSLVAQDLSRAESEQFNQELRLASNFDGPVNFSLGANFTRFETFNDYFVFVNALTMLTGFFPFMEHDAAGNFITRCPGGWEANQNNPNAKGCFYVDRNPLESIDGEGHNYFRSANPYELTSSAVFGEFYWQATQTVKVTLGGRMTWDRKVFTPIPSQLLLHDYRDHVPVGAPPEACEVVGTPGAFCKLSGTAIGGRGSPPNPDIVQEWREPTGRIIVDWKPELGFTDETMVYGSIAHGYKGGGANPPNIAPPAGIANALNSGGINPPTFEPEFINAFEVGTKNTLFGGALVLNGAAFYYDYEGYQVSKIVDRSAYNENFDAKIWGLELEWIWSPTRNLRFNGTVGHLNTEIGEGERSIDLMDRTLGGNVNTWVDADGTERVGMYTPINPATNLPFMDADGNPISHEITGWVVLKPWITNSSNCIIPKELMVAASNGGAAFVDLCPGGGVLGGNYSGNPDIGNLAGPVAGYGFWDPSRMAPNNGAGFWKDLGGNELPNAPHWTASLGGQYRFALPGGWDGTIRGDFYWQDKSFARVYNSEYDRLNAWTNANISLWFEQPDWGVTAEVYVKNLLDESPITDAFLNSDDSGLTTNVFTLDPRLVGLSVRKTF